MPDQKTAKPAPPVPPAPVKEQGVDERSAQIIKDIISNIAEVNNILVALSSNPSVDELCAAIGLTLVLDKVGKHATAIYSGLTPNAIQFLEPDKTLEDDIDSLRDFIVQLNKEKADHLRYKIEGDFVKVFITPYRTTLSEDDLDFSRGDFDVDLVLTIDVAEAVDLDNALREHGRIMHDATIINITTGVPGKFANIEWSDPNASSVSEMVGKLAAQLGAETLMEKDTATALLTGIISATDRFLNEKTTADTMALAAKLMEAGADQQLIATNIQAGGMALASFLNKKPGGDEGLSIDHSVKTKTEEQAAPIAGPAAVSAEQKMEPIRSVEPTVSAPKDYGKMMDAALAEEGIGPEPVKVEEAMGSAGAEEVSEVAESTGEGIPNPAITNTPEVPEVEVGNVPEFSYLRTAAEPEGPPVATGGGSFIIEEPRKKLKPVESPLPMPEEGVLPPPPAPPVDFGTPGEVPAVSVEPPVPTAQKAVAPPPMSQESQELVTPVESSTESLTGPSVSTEPSMAQTPPAPQMPTENMQLPKVQPPEELIAQPQPAANPPQQPLGGAVAQDDPGAFRIPGLT